MDEPTRNALRAVAEASRSLALKLDQILLATDPTRLASPPADVVQPDESGTAGTMWDPEVDPPLVVPRVVGTREEQDWCSLTYLGGIYAINKRYNRGATRAEVRHFAIKAGYTDGRAVTAWSKGNGATQNDDDKQRWVNDAGVNYWVKRLAQKLGLTLPSDLAEDWTAPSFD